MNDSKTRAMEAALAFINVLVEEGENLHENGGGAHFNLIVIPDGEQRDACVGHGEVLQARARDIDAALAEYRASMGAVPEPVEIANAL